MNLEISRKEVKNDEPKFEMWVSNVVEVLPFPDRSREHAFDS